MLSVGRQRIRHGSSRVQALGLGRASTVKGPSPRGRSLPISAASSSSSVSSSPLSPDWKTIWSFSTRPAPNLVFRSACAAGGPGPRQTSRPARAKLPLPFLLRRRRRSSSRSGLPPLLPLRAQPRTVRRELARAREGGGLWRGAAGWDGKRGVREAVWHAGRSARHHQGRRLRGQDQGAAPGPSRPEGRPRPSPHPSPAPPLPFIPREQAGIRAARMPAVAVPPRTRHEASGASGALRREARAAAVLSPAVEQVDKLYDQLCELAVRQAPHQA